MSKGSVARTLVGMSAACVLAMPAHAGDRRADAMEAELAAQRDRIARLEALVERQSRLIESLTGQSQAIAAHPSPPATVSPSSSSPGAGAPPTLAARPAEGPFRIPGLDVAGDLRVREEFNLSDRGTRGRTRTVLRARLRATYAIDEHFTVGGQLATGDPDDPNSTDVTLGSFADDLDISLDQAWMRYQAGGLTAWAGKFPQPFLRTDLVWDGDVSPQGFATTYHVPLGGGAKLDGRAVYFIVDEASGGPDSAMLGFQGVLDAPLGPDLKMVLAGGYFRYRLNSLAGADAGDFRSNLMAGGRYLSRFHLLDGIASLTWSGLGARWPLALTGDYVRNQAAAVSADTGFNVEFSAGRATAPGDWRILYQYSEAEVDAVFAAFSHDNIGLATNYRVHGLGIDYVPADRLFLNATLYHYRPLDRRFAGLAQPSDWLNRIRLNLMMSF